jgi:hypothetical protein
LSVLRDRLMLLDQHVSASALAVANREIEHWTRLRDAIEERLRRWT